MHVIPYLTRSKQNASDIVFSINFLITSLKKIIKTPKL